MVNVRRLLCVIFSVAIAAMPASAGAIRTFPGFQSTSLPKGDDVSAPAVPLGFTIGSMGWSSASVYVDTNGAITFNSPYVGYPGAPEDNHAGGVIPPISSSAQPIISAFLSDIDLADPAPGAISYGTATLNGRPAFFVNYSNVAGFSFSSANFDLRRNSFQIVLVERSDTGSTNFDIELNYDRIQWETADSNGGTNGFGGYPALVGYSNGTQLPGTFYQLPGSGVPGSYADGASLSLVAGSQNSGVAGRYILEIRNTTTPTISSLSPAIAPAGLAFTLTVNGSGFATNSVVIWNSAVAVPTTFISSTQLIATIAANLIASSGTASVGVNTAGFASNGATITLISPTPAPTISSLTPTTMVSSNPGFTLMLNGSGFTANSTVLWNGSAVPTTFVSTTQLTAAIIASLVASPGMAAISVKTGGLVSNTASVTVTAIPASTISSLNPSTIQAGSGGFTLIVTGSGFTSKSTVSWKGAPLATSFASAKQLSAIVPSSLIASQGTAAVTVNDIGTASNAAAFTIWIPAPIITTLSPPAAQSGGASFTLTLSGSGFAPGSVVLWNGAALPTAFVSATQVSAIIPGSLFASPGIAAVTVSTGGLTSNSAVFTIAAGQGLSITSLSPAAIPAGGPAFILTVNGSGFANSLILWNGAIIPTTFVSANQLTASISPSLIAGQGTASVTVRTGRITSNASAFAITGAIPLKSLVPSNVGIGSSSFILTVNGSGFAPSSMILWKGSPLATVYVSQNQLTALISSGLVASQSTVAVTVSTGAALSGGLSFTVAGSTVRSR